MKKMFLFRSISLVMVLTLCLGSPVFAKTSRSSNIIGEALETDIASFIDEWPIESFNVDGYTYVIAEQLADYGFDVLWDSDKWSLFITRNKDKELGWMDVSKINKLKKDIVVGRKTFDILKTTIKTYLDGEEIKAYNVDGQTIVCMEDLIKYGYLNWDEGQRTIKLDMVKKYLDDLDKSYSDSEKGILIFNSFEEAGYPELEDASVYYDDPLKTHVYKFESCEYNGTIKNGKQEGVGKQILKYTGDESFAETLSIEYTGEWHDGKREGLGFIFKTRHLGGLPPTSKDLANTFEKERGHFNEFGLQGRGYSKNLQGMYKNGVIQGYRRLITNDSNFLYGYVVTFEGEYKDGKRNGYIKNYSYKDGSLISEDEYVDGKGIN